MTRPPLPGPGPHTCSEGATLHQCPAGAGRAWGGSGHTKTLCGPLPIYYELFCVKTPGAALAVSPFPHPLPGGELVGERRRTAALCISSFLSLRFPRGAQTHFQERGFLQSTHKEPVHKNKAAFHSPDARKQFPPAVRSLSSPTELKYEKLFCEGSTRVQNGRRGN